MYGLFETSHGVLAALANKSYVADRVSDGHIFLSGPKTLLRLKTKEATEFNTSVVTLLDDFVDSGVFMQFNTDDVQSLRVCYCPFVVLF